MDCCQIELFGKTVRKFEIEHNSSISLKVGNNYATPSKTEM